MGSFTAQAALLGWLPLVLVLFATLPRRRAIVTAFVIAWLFLPIYGYKLPAFPDYTKTTATSLGVMLAILIFDVTSIFKFRFRWFDIPMAIWCCVPMASSISCGYGAYDGLAGVVELSITWGLPYFIGRLYFSDLAGMRELALGIVIGALIYVPFCLWEVKMSPGLHKFVYGFHQHSIAQTRRPGGGYRPMVFMQHGLAVGLFMCLSTLVAMWCWASGSIRTIWKIPISWLTLVLGVTAVLCKSTGAIVILGAGCVVFLAVKYLRTPAVMALVVALPLMYMGARTVGGWDGRQLVSNSQGLGKTRAGSLEYRMNSENGVWYIVQKDLMFGLARFSFAGTKNAASNNQEIVPDGLWIIALGKNGVVGLMALTTVLVLPATLLLIRFRASTWLSPGLGAVAVLALLSTLYLWDSLMNAMINPLWIMAIGGCTACCGLLPTGAPTAQGARPPIDHRAPRRPPPLPPPLPAAGGRAPG